MITRPALIATLLTILVGAASFESYADSNWNPRFVENTGSDGGLLGGILSVAFGNSDAAVDLISGEYVIVGVNPQSKRELLGTLAHWAGSTVKVSAMALNLSQPVRVTEIVRARLGTLPFQRDPLLDGFNGHNATLVTAGFMNRPSYVSPSEMGFILSNYCKVTLRPGPGDVGAVGSVSRPARSFSIVGDGWIFQKRDSTKFTRYLFVPNEASSSVGVNYYSCQPRSVDAGCNDRYPGLFNTVDRLEGSYASMVRDQAQYSMKDGYRRDIRKWEEFAKKLIPQGASCTRDLTRAHERLNSLAELAETIIQ